MAKLIFQGIILVHFLQGCLCLCGPGTRSSYSGTIDGTGSDTSCTWKIVGDPGYVIELAFNIFSFAAGGDKLVVSETNVPDQTFNSANVPKVIYSNSSEITLVLTKQTAANQLFISYRFLTDQCCNSYRVSGDVGSKMVDPTFYLSSFNGSYVRNGSFTTNNGLCSVYYNSAKGRWLARMEPIYSKPWVISTNDFTPGWNQGFAFYGSGNYCPGTAGSFYEYYSNVSSNSVFTTDTKQIRVTCDSVCTFSSVPSAPTNAVVDIPTVLTALSVVTYTCPGGFRFFSVCQKSATWTAVTGACLEKPEASQPTLQPNLAAVQLNASSSCVNIKTPGWPTANYGANLSLTWNFFASDQCDSFNVSFDSRFSVNGVNKTCVGDKVSSFYGTNVVKNSCGTVSPTDTMLPSDGTQNKVVFTSDATGFGIGFMATVCVLGCPF